VIVDFSSKSENICACGGSTKEEFNSFSWDLHIAVKEQLKADVSLRCRLIDDILCKMYDGHYAMAELLLKRYFL